MIRWYYIPLTEFPSYKRMERERARRSMAAQIEETQRAAKWWRRILTWRTTP